jgi:DNA repair protein RAD16
MKEPISQASPVSPTSDGSTSRDESVYDDSNDTPATSVAVTPPESDNNRRQPKKRVSASTRAQQLRSSTFALPSSTSTKRKRGSSGVTNGDLSTESSDAALARELQLEEYGGSDIKRQRTFLDKEEDDRTIQDSEDELSPHWNEFSDHAQTFSPPKTRRSLRSRPSLVDVAMLDDGDLDDEDDYVYSSDDASEADAASPETEDNAMDVFRPPPTRVSRVSNTTRRRAQTARPTARTAARRGVRRGAREAAEDTPPLPYQMGRRVRNNLYDIYVTCHC